MVQPIESVLDDIPAVYLNKEDTKKFRNGQMLNIFESSSKVNKLLVLDKEVVGIGKVEEGTLVPIRMFNI
jgi:tRNA U55 pseudouridine synthase TruB